MVISFANVVQTKDENFHFEKKGSFGNDLCIFRYLKCTQILESYQLITLNNILNSFIHHHYVNTPPKYFNYKGHPLIDRNYLKFNNRSTVIPTEVIIEGDLCMRSLMFLICFLNSLPNISDIWPFTVSNC